MKISANKFVSATYDLYVGGADGTQEELMEKATADRPLSFIFGTGMMLEGFEDKLAGLEPDASFDFVLTSDQAYGEYHDENIVDLPRTIFEVDGQIDPSIIFENNTVPMVDNEGNRLNGTIVSIGDDVITMDFNHPLAGEDLHFVGKVLEVREATQEEINAFLGITGGSGCGGGGDCSCEKDDCSCGDEGHDHECGCGCGH